MNLQKMMKQAQAMQEKLAALQTQIEAEETEGSSGGGMVTVRINGKGNILKLSIDPKLIDPSEKEVIEDLVIAAYNDARQKSESSASEQMRGLAGGLGLPPGFKLPF